MQKQKSFKVIITLFAIVMLLMTGFTLHTSSAQAKQTFTVKTSTKPCKASYKKAATYNKYTKQYYTIKSYLEKLAKKGGTLVLNKGTYKLPCTLYVPSNVTIKLKSGVTLKKTAKTGTKKLAASKTMFELVAPSKANVKKSSKKYNGSKNVKIYSTGKATINMGSISGSTAIVSGHNKNVTISGISFKNMNGGAFIKLGGDQGVSITKCTFSGHKEPGASGCPYAIALEVPDSTTKAFKYTWSKNDKTANTNISITSNSFTGLDSAIGSMKYTANIYHNVITVTGNKFTALDSNAIRVLNWKSATIQSNSFSNIAGGTGSFCGVYASGAINPFITGNTFDYVARPIQLVPGINTGNGSAYAVTYNTVESTYANYMSENTVSNILEYYVRYQKTMDESSTVRLTYYADHTTKDYVITAGCNPFRDHYTDDVWYNSYTKDYYVFKSYLEQLESVGGGTLTVQAGTYSITNTLFVPSNTTINFMDGTTLYKGTNTGFASTILVPSLSMFQLVPPSLSTIAGAVSGYYGAHDINFIGQGNVTIDMLYYDCAKALVLGHNNNVLIKGINFKNYFGHHFIELDASNNVTIANCNFEGSKYTNNTNDYKEAINIDTPDRNTGGFNQLWTSYDRTANNNIIIKDNSFKDVLRAIGSHKYSVSIIDNTTQVYHTKLQILNNTITNTNSYAIRGINWKDCIIKGNYIKNVNSGNTAAILMSGAVNPTITENTFDTADRPITLNTTNNSDSSLPDKFYPATETILDSLEPTGANLSAMLNNTLIDMTSANVVRFFIGGNSKATSRETRLYEYDASHIHYTHPTTTPKSTKQPTAAPTDKPTAAPTTVPTGEPTAAPTTAPTNEPTAAPTTAPSETSVESPAA